MNAEGAAVPSAPARLEPRAAAEGDREAAKWHSGQAGGDHRGLTGAEIHRYSRQLLVPAFGVQGQVRLKNASALVVGAGGLGSPAALYLAAAGIGRLGIVDRDIVELSNLQRQIMHREHDVGTHKSDSASAACLALNSGIHVDAYHNGLTPANALAIVRQYDVVLDCSDNAATRYLVNDASIMCRKPLVSGAALGTEGQLTVFGWRDGPCYRCLFPQAPPAGACQRCADSGVLGPVPGVIGAMQAMEAIKAVSACGGGGHVLGGRMLLYDAIAARMLKVQLRGRASECAVCGDHPTLTPATLATYDYAAFTGGQLNDSAPERLQTVPLSHTISADGYAHAATSGKAHVLLDVRVAHEFEIVALPGSLNIPLSQLDERLPELRAAMGAAARPLPDIAEQKGKEKGGEEQGGRSNSRGRDSADQLDAGASALADGSGAEVPHEGGNIGREGTSSPPGSSLRTGSGKAGGVSGEQDSSKMEAPDGADASHRPARENAYVAQAEQDDIENVQEVPEVAVYVVCRRGNDSQLAVQKLRQVGNICAFDITGGLQAWTKFVDPTFPSY
eukprot:jgi/Mesen1/2610/ME000166S01731